MKRAKSIRSFIKAHRKKIIACSFVGIGLAALLLYKLGSLVNGLSTLEMFTASQAVGFHGIYHDPLYLPIKLVRSILFFIFPDHGQTITRLPSIVFGAFSVLSFYYVMRVWHGVRTAVLTGLLFATSAWVLHVSRVAGNEVLYLWAVPTLLSLQILLQRHFQRWYVAFGSVIIWGMMLYVPGLVWLLIISLSAQRKTLSAIWKHYSGWRKSALIAAGLVWLPLLILRLATSLATLRTWLGLPEHFVSLSHAVKGFVGVPVHLLFRGPQYPDLWLDKAPIFDIFTLVVAFLGLYFYAKHWQNSRSKLLLGFGVAGFVLTGIGGAVGLSVLVALLYVTAGMGLTYLLHEWLKVFPLNPLARGLGIGLVALAVSLSVILNMRAYFIAWPHNNTTKATFQYHR